MDERTDDGQATEVERKEGFMGAMRLLLGSTYPTIELIDKAGTLLPRKIRPLVPI